MAPNAWILGMVSNLLPIASFSRDEGAVATEALEMVGLDLQEVAEPRTALYGTRGTPETHGWIIPLTRSDARGDQSDLRARKLALKGWELRRPSAPAGRFSPSA